ncbi:MAG: methionyl-tRNA formyltransferase [Microthrixaceae bacterium]|nr:methionyl-tRNA formyltransferase [Microthrixaceae bacterium]
MKLVYFGTPAIAVPPLRALVAAGHDVDLVITGADVRRGRGTSTSPSPVKEAATGHGLKVSHDPDDVLKSDAVLGVVVAYGRILQPHLLAHVPMVNLHFSLLPRWRGAAPVERAILAGDETTGVCVMAVEEGLDTGGVYARAETPVAQKTLFELWDELSAVGSELLVEWLEQAFVDGRLVDPDPQVGEVTYAAKLTSEERRLDPSATADEQLAVVRLGNAWTMVGDKRLKVLTAGVNDGRLVPVDVQPEGKRPMSFDAWRHGTPSAQRGMFA